MPKKDKRDPLQSQLENLLSENQNLRGHLRVSAKQEEHLKSVILQLQHDCNKLENQLKEERQKKNELEKTHFRTVKGIEHNSQTEIIGTLKEDVKRLQGERDDKEKEVADLKHSMTELESRLSKVAVEKMAHNPGVADLSDSHRPQKIVEMFSMLYDNKWTDAYEKAEERGNEKQICAYLLDLFKTCWKFCKDTSDTHFEQLANVLLMNIENECKNDSYNPLSSKGKKLIRELRTTSAREALPNLYNKFKSSKIEVKAELQPYVEGCLEVCWYSALYEPQLQYVFEAEDQPDDFRKYTKSGNRVDFVVWPVMYLCDNGPLMYKGVAQFTD